MWTVYLMYREWIPPEGPNEGRMTVDYRIGITRNLKMRCEQQKAAAAWILKEVEDKNTALMLESLLSLKHNIPQTVFVGNVEEQSTLDKIWSYSAVCAFGQRICSSYQYDYFNNKRTIKS